MMSDFDRPGVTLDRTRSRPERRRSAGSRFTEFGDRIARTFGGFDRTRDEMRGWEPGGELEYAELGETEAWEPVPGRFPMARHGYDCVAVDQYLATLERELDELRAGPQPGEVSAELDRIGKETAAILQVAHEQAHEITRRARDEADSCVSDAASNAVAITEGAKLKLRELDSETDAIWHERSRLIEDIRSVSTALRSLADDAADRFPPDPGKESATVAAATPPEGDYADGGQAADADGS